MVKLTDGLWLRRSGVRLSWATSVVSETVSSADSEVKLLCSTKPIRDRGDTLGGPALTVTLASPAPDIVRVKLVHFAGIKQIAPAFELFPDGKPTSSPASITRGTDTLSLKAGSLIAQVDTSPSGYSIAFVDAESGTTLVNSPVKAHGFADVPSKWTLGNISIWNQDGGTSSEQAYKNIPFFFSTAGYGCFINDPGEVELSVGDEVSSRISITLEGESLEYFIIRGPTPKDVLSKYTLLTGRPQLPPLWSFGLWLSTSFTTSYDEKTVSGFLQGMKERNLPLSVFHLDCFWMEQFKWCDFTFDPATFPDPAAFLNRLKDEFGVKDLWQPGLAIIDFTNPAACEWYSTKLEAVLDAGVDSLKTDFAERIPHLDVVFHDGSDPMKMHNYYTQIYNEVVFRLLEKRRGVGEAVLFARSATAGGQRLPIHWGGDTESTFEAMAESLRGGLSLSCSGFGFWAHDIGGFERWVAFGLLSSHSRLHGSGSVRVPWVYDDEAVEVLKRFTTLKARLMPYLFLKAIEAHTTGIPVLRPMVLEFPDDPATHYLDRQYMLGESLLVAPVFDTSSVSFYVPEGVWISFLDGKSYTGPRWFKENHSFLSLPLLVRPGSVLVVGKTATLPEYDFTSPDQVEISPCLITFDEVQFQQL
ncbi:hypothetical protein RQP46_009038 [Phenoliferia psychrophenolica]